MDALSIKATPILEALDFIPNKCSGLVILTDFN